MNKGLSTPKGSRSVERAKNKRFLEFAQLVDLEGAIRYARRRFSNSIEEEEIELDLREKASIIFIKNQLRNDDNPTAFMMVVTRNFVNDRLRSIYRRRRYTLQEIKQLDWTVGGSAHSAPSNHSSQLEDPDRLNKNLDELTEFLIEITGLKKDQINYLIDHYYRGKSVEEMAELLTDKKDEPLKTGALRVRMYRVRESIKDKLGSRKDFEKILKEYTKNRPELESILESFEIYPSEII